MIRTLATAWHGTYLLEDGRTVRSARAPRDPAALADRSALRSAGSTTPEEEELLASRGAERWTTSDRRLVRTGVAYDPRAPRAPAAEEPQALQRTALLLRAERALAEAWDPSVHLEETVRVLTDVDRAANLLGERLASWATRDRPELEGEDHLAVARALLAPPTASAFAPEDPSVNAVRTDLAELLVRLSEVRASAEQALRSSVPTRAPNLSQLLGPELAARLVAQAGGLDRLAVLPASTVQVLGAERAFFEHLRGRAPPPRHGLLFLHPTVQSAPRPQRGKLARALAAKAAIAARLDRAGAPLDRTIAEAYERRRAAVRASRPAGATGPRGRRRSLAPLDRASGDR